MQTSEAWATGRPIFSRLPGENEGYTGNAVADWLTDYWDALLLDTRATIIDLRDRQLDPLTCDPDYLDLLAPLCGFSGEYWDRNWSEEGKRALLAVAYTEIWINKGTKEVLEFVLNSLGVRALVEVSGDFRVDISEVGDRIGTLPWDYTIYLPPEYEDQPQETLTRRINYLFGVLWCEWRIAFDATRFIDYEILVSEDLEIITSEADEAIQTN
jgi:Phage tail protein (Tail_P2_I)